jgi:hypothetical protein
MLVIEINVLRRQEWFYDTNCFANLHIFRDDERREQLLARISPMPKRAPPPTKSKMWVEPSEKMFFRPKCIKLTRKFTQQNTAERRRERYRLHCSEWYGIRFVPFVALQQLLNSRYFE